MTALSNIGVGSILLDICSYSPCSAAKQLVFTSVFDQIIVDSHDFALFCGGTLSGNEQFYHASAGE